MRRLTGSIAAATLSLLCAAHAAASTETSRLSPQKALDWLRAGNERFVADTPAPREPYDMQRRRLADAQHPFAVVLTCADSRVDPAVVFDQGLGDLFVTRLAGNVIDTDVLGSAEYAVEHLDASLLVVLGHTKCGAVKAVVTHGKFDGNLKELLRRVHAEGDDVDAAVRANVRFQVDEAVRKSDVLREAVAAGRVMIVGGVYDLSSGAIEWVPASAAAPVAHAEKKHAETPAKEPAKKAATASAPAPEKKAAAPAAPAKTAASASGTKSVTPAKSVVPPVNTAAVKKAAESQKAKHAKSPDIVATKTESKEPKIVEASTTHK